MRTTTERGSATPFVVAFIVLTGVLATVLGRLGEAAVSSARARTAADAAALAGAAEGRGAAEELAAANGGRVVAYERKGADTRVAVMVGKAKATARARRGPAGDQDDARR